MLSTVISLKKILLQILKRRHFHSVLYHYCSSLLRWLCWFVGMKKIKLMLHHLINPYGSGQETGNLHFGIGCKCQLPGGRTK